MELSNPVEFAAGNRNGGGVFVRDDLVEGSAPSHTRRVLVLINGVVDTYGGNLRAAVNIAEAMSADGVDVTFSAPIVPAQPHRTVDAMDAKVRRRLFRASRPVARFGGSARQFYWLLRHVRTFDQVQTHSIFTISAVYAILICAVRRVPIVLWPHGSLDPFDLRKHARFKRLVGPLVTRRLLDRCAVLVFTASQEAQVAVTYGSRVQREVVPLPVRPMPDWHEDRDQWLARFGVPEGVPVVLFFGRIDYKKRLPLLVEAISLLDHRNAHLLVVGDGLESQKQRLAQAVDRYGLSDRVHVTGWVEGADRAAAFATADVFALLSDAENFGLSVVEALSVGCPVVISDQLALSQKLAASGAAAVVERDARQAAQAMDGILADPAVAAQMRARAKDFVIREFSPGAVAHRLRQLDTTTGPA